MKPTLAAVLQQHGGAYLRTHTLSTPQSKAWRAVCACRTPALGGQRLVCDHCDHSHWQYHSCRNRHCPSCGARAKEAWLQARVAQVLDVPYTHLVFALPHEFNALYRQQPRAVIDALFASVAQTLNSFAANPRWMGVAGGQAAFTLVLHTWSQDLGLHIHLHAIMACGVLAQGVGEYMAQWHTPFKRADYLFPTRALSRVWRGKFMDRVCPLLHGHATQDEQTEMGEPTRVALAPKDSRALWKKDWVVYAKTPLGGAAQVLAYLSRYTHRTAIGNERIRSISDTQVVFTARAKAKAGNGAGAQNTGQEGKQKRRVRLTGEEFIRRFVQHVLPTGLKRIRHYGLLANCQGHRLALARAALSMPALSPAATECAQVFMQRVAQTQIRQCPACIHGRLVVVQVLVGARHLPVPGQAGCGPSTCHTRGPPP